MSNLKFIISTLFALVLLASCSEDLHNTQEGIETSELLTGDELPVMDEVVIAKSLREKDEVQIEIGKLGNKEFTESPGFIDNKNILSKSRSLGYLRCNQAQDGSTVYESNTVDIYNGPDKVYLLEVDVESVVTIDLHRLSSDLDLFLTEVVVDGYGRKLIGSRIASSTRGGADDEMIDVNLEEGKYFVIVETYNSPSDYTIVVDCSPVYSSPTTWCEDYQGLVASYTRGVSQQSNLWNKWSSNSRDGLVLYETSYNPNKVVKFDARRFGYQDAVRELIGLPIHSGIYGMTFRLYVGENGRCDMISEKQDDYGAEQGFGLTIDDNQLTVRHAGRTATASTYIPESTWMNVYMYFDMDNEDIYVFINNVLILMDTRKTILSNYNRHNAIVGIDFFNKTYSSKFHVDDICVTEYEPGYDDPLQSIINTDETLDLR